MAARPDRAGRQTCEGYAFVGAEFHLRALFDGLFLVCLRLLRRSRASYGTAATHEASASLSCAMAEECGSPVMQPAGAASPIAPETA